MQVALIVSLILSIIHSVLFYRQNVGISVVLFSISVIIGLYITLNKNGKIKNKKALILSIPIILLSSTYFIFNNQIFNVLNVFVILALFATMIIWMLNDKLKFTLLLSKIFNIIIGPLEFIGETFKLIKKVFSYNKEDKNSKMVLFKRIAKALLISLPILLVVLFLLISADDSFAKIFSWISDYIVELFTSVEFLYLILRLFIIFILFIYFVSFIYNLVDEHSSFNVIEKVTRPKEIKIDIFTVNVVLTVLNIVYLIFSIIQVVNIIDRNSSEVYSQSARQGFFQLMILSAINLVLVIISKINKSEKSNLANKYTKIMNILMVIFTIILIIVSFSKMNMYQEKYGYTRLRLFVYTALVTEGLLIIPTILYILKEKINLFYSYLGIILTMYVVVNFVNIDKMIAKRNVDLYFETGKIDFEYLEDLKSADVIPDIKRLLNNTIDDEELTRNVNNYLYNQKTDIKKTETWQSYNISINRAAKELESLDLEYMKKEYKNTYDYNYYDNYNYNAKGL